MVWWLASLALADCPGISVVHPAQFGPVGTDNDAPTLNAMFQWVEDNSLDGRAVCWPDRYEVTETVHVQGTRAHHYVGVIENPSGATIGDLVRIDGWGSTFTGILRVRGDGGSVHANRSVTHAVVLGNINHARFDGIEAQYARRHCITTEGWPGIVPSAIDADLGQVEASDCGSAASIGVPHVAKVELVVTGRTDTSVSSSVQQRSILDVDLSSNPGDLQPDDLVFVGGDPYVITAVDEAGGTVSVFPWIADLGWQTGTLTWSGGAAVYAVGGNTTGLRAGRVQVLRAGEGIAMRGLYGGAWGGLTTESTGVGVSIGAETGAAHLGGFVGQAHLEGTLAHVVQIARTHTPVTFGAMAVWDPARHYTLDTWLQTTRQVSLDGILFLQGQPKWSDPVTFANNGEPNTTILGNATGQGRLHTPRISRTNPTITLRWDDLENRHQGSDAVTFLVAGNNLDNPGTITLQIDASDPGGLINGAPPPYVVAPGGPCRITAWREVDDLDWRVWVELL